jgi:hypothetical protein
VVEHQGSQEVTGDILYRPLRVELDIFDDGSGAHTSLYWLVLIWTSPS